MLNIDDCLIVIDDIMSNDDPAMFAELIRDLCIYAKTRRVPDMPRERRIYFRMLSKYSCGALRSMDEKNIQVRYASYVSKVKREGGTDVLQMSEWWAAQDDYTPDLFKGKAWYRAALDIRSSTHQEEQDADGTAWNQQEADGTAWNHEAPNINTNVNSNDNDNSNDNVNSEREKGEIKGKGKQFVPPTVDEVRAYCEERMNNIDPEYFVDWYTAQKWYRSKGVKMSDWKAAVRTWEKNERSKPQGVQREDKLANLKQLYQEYAGQ